MKWLNKVILKIASEVHKSKIDELEKRIIGMEKKHEVFIKTISDNEKKIEKLEDRVYQSDLIISKFDGALNVLIEKAKTRQPKILEGGLRDE